MPSKNNRTRKSRRVLNKAIHLPQESFPHIIHAPTEIFMPAENFLRPRSRPIRCKAQQRVGNFAVFLLISVTRALNEDQLIRGGGGHVVVDCAQEFRRVALREFVAGADNQSAEKIL